MAKKSNMLLVDLNDPRTKSVAETITSVTSRKILDYLAGVETASETEIAKELSIAISTAHYHMQKLQEAELVDVSGFTYSKKGREINRYTLANKYIIITPRKMSGLKSKLRKILPIVAVPLGLAGVLKVVDIYRQSFAGSIMAASDSNTFARTAMVEEVVEESAIDMEEVVETVDYPELMEGGDVMEFGFHLGLHEIAIALLILSVLIVAGYFVWDWWASRK